MIYESVRKMTHKEQEAYDLGYLSGKGAALRGPRPDPITGLVPCGCGGKAEIVRAIEYWDWIAQNKVEVKKVQCDKCYMSTSGSVTNEYAMQKWNTAMSGGQTNE